MVIDSREWPVLHAVFFSAIKDGELSACHLNNPLMVNTWVSGTSQDRSSEIVLQKGAVVSLSAAGRAGNMILLHMMWTTSAGQIVQVAAEFNEAWEKVVITDMDLTLKQLLIGEAELRGALPLPEKEKPKPMQYKYAPPAPPPVKNSTVELDVAELDWLTTNLNSGQF